MPFITQLTVFGTIAGATVAWALAEVWRSRAIWTTGAILLTLHSVAAFGVFHEWRHDAALAATARQTAAVTGLSWGGGLYVNYACLAIWAGDVLWWWIAPQAYANRRAAVSTAVRGFIFFMFFNGAVVFADGWMRGLGMVTTAAVALAWYRNVRLLLSASRST